MATRTPASHPVPPIRVQIENFGPIRNADLDFRRVSVLLGPNNSGKSYAAMLLNGIHTLLPTRDESHFKAFSYFSRLAPERKVRLGKIGAEIDRALAARESKRFEIPQEISRTIIEKIVRDLFEDRLRVRLAEVYGEPLGDLVQFGEESSSVRVTLASGLQLAYRIDSHGLALTSYSHPPWPLIVETAQSPQASLSISFAEGGVKLIVSPDPVRLAKEPPPQISMGGMIEQTLFSAVGWKVAFDVSANTYYVPAARSGLMQVQTLLMSNLLMAASSGALPRVPSSVTEFINSLLRIDPKKEGPFGELASEFSRVLSGGTISVVPTATGHSEVSYSIDGRDIPMSRASSTVTETAPLLLIIKHLLQPGNVLIVEEPEAHLHPENQRQMARLLMRLASEGVSIVVTTHSEFLLSELNHLLRVHSKPLTLDDVSAYLFQSREGSSSAISVPITPGEGISESEFARVHEALYDQDVRDKFPS